MPINRARNWAGRGPIRDLLILPEVCKENPNAQDQNDPQQTTLMPLAGRRKKAPAKWHALWVRVREGMSDGIVCRPKSNAP